MTEGAPESGELARPNPLALDLQLCFSLYTASNLMTRLYRPLLQPLGLTYLQYLAMLVLWEQSPQTVGDLGHRLGLDSGTLTPLFKRMEQAGLISRTRDPADERRVIVALTDAGLALKARAAEVPGAIFCQLPGPLEDLVDLKAAVDRLVGALRADIRDG
ncbi:MarR family winged helix-turn-helix transcriptional regulator [Phenylobacterium kunshanense]|uniref:MarR family transcriptional regulator n=1 Tax=Phenylobacterium kunshanense TaxID=1445034 RepID=A0A328BBR5_9CAUL|nr:MarR family transcriptional regulator [Phenylobacterium kunshanense]RAK64762.1 MarR family transcriptional regulator [Phenylobacterium kunshanense]